MAFHRPKGKQAGKRPPKPSPARLPNCWLCSGCKWWQFACPRDSTTPVKSCFRTRDCGIARGANCVHWKNATAAQKAKPGGTTAAAGAAGGAAPAGGGPVGGAPAAAPAARTPWRQKQAERRQRQLQNGGGGAKAAAAPKESPELVAARAAVRAHETIVELYLGRYGEGTQVTEARATLDAATAEVERLLPAAATGDLSEYLAQLQNDYDRYLDMHGADDPIVVSLRKKLEAGTAPESPTARAVREAKQLLDLLVEHDPNAADRIQEARSALDKAKIANGSRESDCYQSAEAALKQAEDAVEAIHADIEATKTAYDAILAQQKKQAADLLAATETRDAAKKRVQDRMLAISTKAPGVLQPSDAQTMSERMQQLDTVVRHVHGLGTQHGGVPAEAMQRVMECVAQLMQAAPSTIFTQSVTSEPQAAVAGGVVIADGGASGSTVNGTLSGPPEQTAAPPTPSTSLAAMQAKFDTRERERTAETAREAARVAAAAAAAKAAAEAAAAAEARANNERAAETMALQQAMDAEAAAAAATAAEATAAAAAAQQMGVC